MKCNIKTNYQQISQNCAGVLKYWAYSHSVIHAARDLRRSRVPPPAQSRASSEIGVEWSVLFPTPSELRLDTRQPPWATYPAARCPHGEKVSTCIQSKPLLLSLALLPCTIVKDPSPPPWWAPGHSGHPPFGVICKLGGRALHQLFQDTDKDDK